MSSPLATELKERGYILAHVRPVAFSEKHIPDYSDLESILRRSAVSLRGWDLPYIDDRRAEIVKGSDWISQETDWEYYKEVWRFHQSGLFLFMAGYRWDWREGTSLAPLRTDWPDSKVLPVLYTTYWITEVFELAARLSVTAAGAPAMYVAVTLTDLKGRQLVMDDPRRMGFIQRYVADVPTFTQERELERDELVARPRDFALEFCRELFARFGWNTNIESLRELQETLQAR